MKHPANRPDDSATSPKRLQGPALYLRWLGILCGLMAVFCLGVFAIGYQGPSFGRVATCTVLIIACPTFLLLSARMARR